MFLIIIYLFILNVVFFYFLVIKNRPLFIKASLQKKFFFVLFGCVFLYDPLVSLVKHQDLFNIAHLLFNTILTFVIIRIQKHPEILIVGLNVEDLSSELKQHIGHGLRRVVGVSEDFVSSYFSQEEILIDRTPLYFTLALQVFLLIVCSPFLGRMF